MRYLGCPHGLLNYCVGVESPGLEDGNLFAIGSVLDYAARSQGKAKTLGIYGSGFLRPPLEGEIWRNAPIHVYALRGKRTRDRLEGLMGQNYQHVPLGDPGLLIHHLFPQVKRSHRYRVGVIRHYTEEAREETLAPFQFKETSWRTISILQRTQDFVEQVAECDLILSSALHGLICADALGIPNRYIHLTDIPIGGDYKFHDYYSAFEDVPMETLDLRHRTLGDADVDTIIAGYRVKPEEVTAIAHRLIRAFPPTVTVVLPMYNAEAYLRETLNSLQAQSFRNWECLCVDDGSTDGSADIVRSYEAQDPRFRLICQENAGAAAARNRGIDEARGEYLLFLDADDLINPSLMEICVAQLHRSSAALCAFEHVPLRPEEKRRLTPVDPHTEVISLAPREHAGSIFRTIAPTPWNKMYRLDHLRTHALRFPTELKRSEDTAFAFMSLALAESVSWVKKPLYYYRQDHCGSLTRTMTDPAAFNCSLHAAKLIWDGLREHGLLREFGAPGLRLGLANALFYHKFLPYGANMLAATCLLRHFMETSLMQLHELAAAPSPEQLREMEDFMETFSYLSHL